MYDRVTTMLLEEDEVDEKAVADGSSCSEDDMIVNRVSSNLFIVNVVLSYYYE